MAWDMMNGKNNEEEVQAKEEQIEALHALADTGVTLGMGQRVVVRLMEATPVTGGLMLELLTLEGNPLPAGSGRGGKRGGYQPRMPGRTAAKDRAVKRKVIRKRK